MDKTCAGEPEAVMPFHGSFGYNDPDMNVFIQKHHPLQVFLCLCLLLAGPVMAHEVVPHTGPSMSSKPAELGKIIKQKIEYYNKTYPEIHFVHVDGGDDWHGDLLAIITMLGTSPDALDYQHPPDLRETLMNVTMERLRIMLQADVVSATLFRVGQESILKRPNLCVITLNPNEFVSSDYQATRYMLDLDDDVMKKVHPARYLDHIHHLMFTLDHEAFHCLDSYFNGGSPQTEKELGGEYNLFRRESVADAYAMAFHIREHGDVTPYARNIAHARALWLFTDSPNRCTFETLREVISYDDKVIRSVPVKDLISLATHVRNKTVGNYDAYVAQRVAAIHAAMELGRDIAFYGEQWEKASEKQANPALVKHLINRYEYYYAKLFTDDPIPMVAPHGHEWKK